jgi:hypothetical protein
VFDFAGLHSWAQRIVDKDFAGVITGSLPGDDPLLLRLGFFRMLRLSFF